MVWIDEVVWGIGLSCLRRAGIMKRLEEVRAIQGSPGNWDHNDYMAGMYNGMEVIMATLTGVQPVFKTPVVKEVRQDDSGWAYTPSGRDEDVSSVR